MMWGKISKYFTKEELCWMANWYPEMDYNKALAVIGRVYAEKLDKSGNVELCHFINVSNAATIENGRIVGLLHDIVEDGFIDLTDLVLLGFNSEIIKAVQILNHDKKKFSSYKEYILAVVNSGNFLAIETKLNDIRDNMSPRRMLSLPIEKQQKALKKYSWALPVVYAIYQKYEDTLIRRKTK